MKFKIIVEEFETKEKEKFNAYKMIDEKGKRIDCRFTRLCFENCGENMAILNKCKKAWILTKYDYKISKAYEFPRIYINEIDSVEKIS